MFGFGTNDGRPSLLVGTVKAVSAVALLSFLAANWLSGSRLDQGTLARLAASTVRGDDPTTTGTIAKSAAQTRLDPCAVPRKP